MAKAGEASLQGDISFGMGSWPWVVLTVSIGAYCCSLVICTQEGGELELSWSKSCTELVALRAALGSSHLQLPVFMGKWRTKGAEWLDLRVVLGTRSKVNSRGGCHLLSCLMLHLPPPPHLSPCRHRFTKDFPLWTKTACVNAIVSTPLPYRIDVQNSIPMGETTFSPTGMWLSLVTQGRQARTAMHLYAIDILPHDAMIPTWNTI